MRAGGAPAPAAPPSGAQAGAARHPRRGQPELRQVHALQRAHRRARQGQQLSRRHRHAHDGRRPDLPGVGPADLVDLPGTYSLERAIARRAGGGRRRCSAAAASGPTPCSSSPTPPRSRATSTSPTRSSKPARTSSSRSTWCDEARASGIDDRRLQRLAIRLGAPVVPIVARSGEGLPGLLRRARDRARRAATARAGGGPAATPPGATSTSSPRSSEREMPTRARHRARVGHVGAAVDRRRTRRTIWPVFHRRCGPRRAASRARRPRRAATSISRSSAPATSASMPSSRRPSGIGRSPTPTWTDRDRRRAHASRLRRRWSSSP